MTAKPGRLLCIHILESDFYQGKPLFGTIVAKCRELKIADATVFRGLEGYGESAELHRAHHLAHHDQPIVNHHRRYGRKPGSHGLVAAVTKPG